MFGFRKSSDDLREYYQDYYACKKHAQATLIDKQANKLLTHIKQYNDKGCYSLRRGLNLLMCNQHPKEQEHTHAGYYDLKGHQIVLCCDRVNAYSMKETMMHEMVHAIDMCRLGSNWYCKARACSEVRAYNIGGTCNSRETLRLYYNGSKEECLKDNAHQSTRVACSKSVCKPSPITAYFLFLWES